MKGWKLKIMSFIYQYKGNDWFTQTIKEMLDNCIEEERADERAKVIEEVAENILPTLYKHNVHQETLNNVIRLLRQLKEVE